MHSCGGMLCSSAVMHCGVAHFRLYFHMRPAQSLSSRRLLRCGIAAPRYCSACLFTRQLSTFGASVRCYAPSQTVCAARYLSPTNTRARSVSRRRRRSAITALFLQAASLARCRAGDRSSRVTPRLISCTAHSRSSARRRPSSGLSSLASPTFRTSSPSGRRRFDCAHRQCVVP